MSSTMQTILLLNSFRGREGLLNNPGSINEISSNIDECFYVLQRCGLRAVATGNIHVSCAILHSISDLLSSDLLNSLNEILFLATDKVTIAMITHVSRYINQIKKNHGEATTSLDDNNEDEGSGQGLGIGFDQLDKTFLSGYQSAMALANSVTTRTTTVSTDNSDYSNKIKLYLEKQRLSSDIASHDEYGVADCAEAFNLMDSCSKYVGRLGNEVVTAGERNFGEPKAVNSRLNSATSADLRDKTAESELLSLCREDFYTARSAYIKALDTSFNSICECAKSIIRDLLQQVCDSLSLTFLFLLVCTKTNNQPSLPILLFPKINPILLCYSSINPNPNPNLFPPPCCFLSNFFFH